MSLLFDWYNRAPTAVRLLILLGAMLSDVVRDTRNDVLRVRRWVTR